MRSQREVSVLSPLHRASFALHSSLVIEHRRNNSLLSSTARHVLSTPKHSSNLANFIETKDAREKLSGQVRALNNFCIPDKNQKLEQLIEKQHENRRQTHKNLLQQYENWAEKFSETMVASEKQLMKR